MLFRPTVALAFLLIPVAVGCRTTQPDQPEFTASEPGYPDAFPGDTAERRAAATAGGVAQAQFEVTEILPSQSPVGAVPRQILTLADAESMALAASPALGAAEARIDAALGRQTQAGLYPNPHAGYHATEVGNLGTAGAQGGFVSQRLITGGKRRLDQAIAERDVDEAHFRFHARRQQVLGDVRVRYFEALAAQRRVELTKDLARIGDDLVAATEKLLKARQGTENDLLQAQIRADESHVLFDNARNEHLEAWRRLAAVLGAPNMSLRPLAGELEDDLPQINWNQCRAVVLDGHPDLNAAQARLERADVAVARARKEPIPDVDVFVSVRHQNVTGDDVANVEVGIPLPIFDRNQGNIQAAEAEWIAACREIERIELDLQDRAADAYRRYANARQTADRYRRETIAKAQRSLELVAGGYEKGQVDYLTLLTAQQTHVQVNLAYLEALRQMRAAAAEIESQLLTGSLRRQP